MSEIYNEKYYKEYDVGVGKVDYADSEYTKGFLTRVAKHIAEDLQPKTVLDAGCAMGHLVAALRDNGIEAYGIDISEYAISKVREDIRPYCAVGELTQPLPKDFPDRFDLVISVEVLEHLYEEDAAAAIHNLCSLTDRVIFSSTPDDLVDPTHFNVRPREYWAKLFAAEGFFDDLKYRPLYLTQYASTFYRSDNMIRQVEDYERNIRITESSIKEESARWQAELRSSEELAQQRYEQLQEKETCISNLKTQLEADLSQHDNELETMRKEVARQEENAKKLSDDLAQKQKDCTRILDQYNNVQNQLNGLNAMYTDLVTSRCWRATKPIRVVKDCLRKVLKSNKYTNLFCKGIISILKMDIRVIFKKLQYVLSGKKWMVYFAKDLVDYKKIDFPRNVKFSILVPLYNTPEKFLKEMIRSVQAQVYGNWELCLADGSDDEHSSVGKICSQYVRKDKRIVYQKLEKNMGISENTNACIRMATGEYIALFDHDDILHPSALYEMMKAICEKDADMIYTDENTFRNNPRDAYCPHYKSDYAPDTLRSYNYICHFTAFSKELLEKAGGGFRPEFDGSQDYDLILRLTENAKHIVHIPQILYYWRCHAGSVASGISAKPYTIDAAKRALSAHLARVGLKGEVLDAQVPSTYKIQYEIQGTPLISILIPNKDHVDDLRLCLTSIIEKSSYSHFEIIVIENNSTEAETFAYYEQVQEDPRIRVVTWDGIFNYSAINNFGQKFAKGEYLLLLNNDVEVINPDWLEQMLMFAQRKNVGAVGAKLYYPDDTIQHGGVIVGLGGVAGHAHKNYKRYDPGYMSRLQIAQNFSAVTAACLMLRRDVWNEVDGLDETFQVAFNDVDLCMRIRKAGYLIVWTPYTELYHYESKSRGLEDTLEKQRRFAGEISRFRERWKAELEAGDPYYNPNLTYDREDFTPRD